MAIRPQVLAGSKITAADNSIYTHTNNVQDPKPMTGDLDLKNNQQDTQDLMVDPDHTPGTNGDGDIYTHSNNDKDVKAEKGSSAAQRDKNPGKVKANADDGPGPGATTNGGGEAPAQKMVPDDTINISTIPNDVNPLDGYPLKDNCAPGVLEEGQGGDSKVEGASEPTDLENNQQGEQKLDVEAALTVANQGGPGATTNQGAGTPQNMAPLIADEGANPDAEDQDDWEEGQSPLETPPAAPEGEPGIAPAAPMPAPAAAPVAPAPVAPAVAPAAPAVPPVVAPAPVPAPCPTEAPLPMNLGVGNGDSFEGEDVMSILDADGTDDADFDGLAFAQMGASVLVLKNDRVIAKMDEQTAITAGAHEFYTTEQFQEVALAECQRYGLRAGLESMGYVLSEVNIGRSEVINARVEAHVEQRTQEVRAQYQEQNTSYGHCLAIASVGINRGFWQDVPNELRAALENQLTSAGLRNAGRVVREVFAQYGTSYAKAIVAMADKLSHMSEQTRNELAAALDLVAADGKFDDPTDDSQEVHASVQDDEFDTPASVTAALSFAGQSQRDRGVLLTPKQTGYSVTAAAFLNSDDLLFNR